MAAAASSSSPPPNILCLKKSTLHLFQELIDKGDVFQWKEPELEAKVDWTDFLFQLQNGKTIPNPLFPNSKYFRTQVAQLAIPLADDKQQIKFQTTKPVPFLAEGEVAHPIPLETIITLWYYMRVFNIYHSTKLAMQFLSLSDESIAHIDILDHFDIPRLDVDERCILTHHRLSNIIAQNFFLERAPDVDRDVVLLNTQSAVAHEFLRCCQDQEQLMPKLISVKELFSEQNLVAHNGIYYLQVPVNTLMVTFVHDFIGQHGQAWSRHQDDFI